MRFISMLLLSGILLPTALFASQPNIHTFAGTGTAGNSGDNGLATAAKISSPGGMSFDGTNLFFCDTGNNCVRRIDASGTITTVAGTGVAGFSGDGGLATAAQLNGPIDVFVGGNGDYYIADRGNHRIRLVSKTTGMILTIVGNGTAGFSGDGGAQTDAQLNFPSGVYSVAGEIYISDAGNNRIRKVSGGKIATIAGTGTAGFSGDNGPATAAKIDLVSEAFGFAEPCGIIVNATGDVFFSDTGNIRVRKISGGTITTFCGNGTFGSSVGTDCTGLALAPNGDLLIAGTVDHRVVRADGTTGIFTVIAGTGAQGFSGDNGPSDAAQLRDPYGLAVDSDGAIYIADTFNQRIRMIDAPMAAPQIVASQNPVRVGVDVTFNFTGTFAAPLTWDFGDGTPTAQGNPVTHNYATENTFTVTNLDGNAAENSLDFATIAPSPNAGGVPNTSINSTVTNPLNSIGTTVSFSDGGVVELDLDIVSQDRAPAAASTFFNDFPTRRATSVGTKPAHKFTQPGIFTTTTTVTDSVSGAFRGKNRRTLAVSSRETGDSSALPAPTDSVVVLKSIKGKFLFTKENPDSVSFSGEVKLPAGFDPLKPDGYSFSIGIGNVVDTLSLTNKGRGVLPSSGVLLKKAAVKYPRLAKGMLVTTEGQIAKIQASLFVKNLDAAGFDTEGITNRTLDSEAALKTVPRTIQVQILLAGIAYELLAPVDYKLSKKADSGSFVGRRANVAPK